MRCKFEGVYRDGAGNVVKSGTATIYLARTTTAANVYKTATSTTAVNSLTTSSVGKYTFYVDRFEYDAEQTFKIVLSKTGYTSATYDNVAVDNPVIKTYTISTDTTVATAVEIPKGVLYSVASGKTLTFSVQPQINGDYQVFTGYGTVQLGVSNPKWFGATGDGTTDDSAEVQAALNSVSVGGALIFSPQTYAMSGQLLIDAPITIDLNGGTLDWTTDTINQGILITTSGVEIRNGTIKGPQFAAAVNTQTGIYAYGADSSHYISGLKLRDLTVEEWGFAGVRMKFAENSILENVTVADTFYIGVSGNSCRDITGTNIVIDGVSGKISSSAYGIIFTRDETDDLVANPKSTDITLIHPIVRNVAYWDGINGHAVDNFKIISPTVTGCFQGISIVPCSDGTTPSMYGGKNLSIVGGIIDSVVTDGSVGPGLVVKGGGAGGGVGEYTNGAVTGLTIVGHGNDSNTTGHAVSLVNTRGLSFTGNTIAESSPIAIYASADNLNLNISGNTIIDPWTDDQTAAKAIYVTGTASGYIGDNIFARANKSATNILNHGIHFGAGAQKITLGKNYSEAKTYLLDGQDSTLTGLPGTVSTSGTGEDTLQSKDVEAYRCGIGNKLTVQMAGTITDTANGNKTVKLYIGSTAVTVIPAADHPTGSWTAKATVVFNSAGAQRIQYEGIVGTTIVSSGYTTAGEDETAGFTLKSTGECSDGTDVVSQTIWDIDMR